MVGNRASGKRPQWPSRMTPAMASSRAAIGGKPGGEPLGPRAERSQSLAGDAARHRRIEVERDDRQLLPRGDREERLVHADVRPAAGAPAQALVQVPGRERSGERLIDIRLLVFLEHLESERGRTPRATSASTTARWWE